MKKKIAIVMACVAACVFVASGANAGLADSVRRFLEIKTQPDGFQGTRTEAFNIGTDDDRRYAILSGISFGTEGGGVDDDPATENSQSATGRPYWAAGEWGACESECGDGHAYREVVCRSLQDGVVDDSLCDPAGKPVDNTACAGDCQSITKPVETLTKTNYTSKSGKTGYNCPWSNAMGFVSGCNASCWSITGQYTLNIDRPAPPAGYHYLVKTTFRTMRGAGMDFNLYVDGTRVARSYVFPQGGYDWGTDKTYPISARWDGAIGTVKVYMADIVEWPACVLPVEIWIEKD